MNEKVETVLRCVMMWFGSGNSYWNISVKLLLITGGAPVNLDKNKLDILRVKLPLGYLFVDNTPCDSSK